MALLGRNIDFAIKNANGTPFHNLVIKKATYDSVVMSLGDSITGDVYYKDNTLTFTMQEYIEWKYNPDDENETPIKFVLVNPPTIIREGMASDNSELKGMTKYSLTFYHPMYKLGSIAMSDIAVTQDERKYLSQNKTFSWVGNLFEFSDKLNAMLATTEWQVYIDIPQYEEDGVTLTQQWQKAMELCEVTTFNNQYISDGLKFAYDTWEIPFTITPLTNVQGKTFAITFGTPSQKIYDTDGITPYVFQMGQGVGLKNNSRTPKNNKIVTRIFGYGSDRNIPYGYPQIVWTGLQSWDYTINNAEGMQPIEIGGQTIMAMSYPIYDGIVGGQYVRLIKHPFTRTTLMPSVYVESVNKKVNPLATGYDPDQEIIDYYDADNSYHNPINLLAPSCELHQFEDEYPHLGEARLVGVEPYDSTKYISQSEYITLVNNMLRDNNYGIWEDNYLRLSLVYIDSATSDVTLENTEGSTPAKLTLKYHQYEGGKWFNISMVSPSINFKYNVYVSNTTPQTSPKDYVDWDDSMNEDGEYNQSYFKLKLPQLDFDLYACAAITEEMKINMRSGNCMGCTFPIQVDWEDYKKNFYKEDGTFDPVIHQTEGDGHVRNGEKYPDSRQGSINVVVQKDLDTFGRIMPNTYQKPKGETTTGANDGDKFVVIGISLPQSYVDNAQQSLDNTIKEYMLENNVYYYEYPLKFDEHFLAKNTNILRQIKNNCVLRFRYASVVNDLYIKQITIKYGQEPLPQYDITLTDDVKIVLNQLGQVTDDVSRMRVQINELQKYYSEDLIKEINNKLSRVVDDVCQGRITFQQGLNVLGRIILSDEIASSQFTSGLYDGRGWRIDQLGNGEMESLRVRSFLEVIELLINRMQAQEGDTLFTDNDQIEMVETITYNGTTYYKLSLKEKWEGYITSQEEDNVLKGIINTLAAKNSRISDVTDEQSVEADGDNKYYTSWMRIVSPQSAGTTVGNNQIVVMLYGDNLTPAGKNFPPCELMTIARWGCAANPDESGLTPAQKASIERRQRLFSISTIDGRITKLRGVRTPKLQEENYGTTLGILPSFVQNWTSVASKLSPNRDYLYAQGIVVQDFIKVKANGEPIEIYVDCGDWLNNTPYYNYEYNPTTLQWETSDVWHNGSYWRCKMTQPVVIGGISTYYEPNDQNTNYWEKLLTSGEDGDDGITYNVVWNDSHGVLSSIPCSANGGAKGTSGGGGDTWMTTTLYKRIGSGSTTALVASSIVLHAYLADGSEVTQSGSGFPQTASNASSISMDNYESSNGTHVRYLVEFKDANNNVIASSTISRNIDGADGNDGVTYSIECSPSQVTIAGDASSASWSGLAKFYKTVGSTRSSFSAYYALYSRSKNGVFTKITHSTRKLTQFDYTSSSAPVSTTTDALIVYVGNSIFNTTTEPTSFVSKFEIPVLQNGSRGRVGRFFYYGGVFDSEDDNVTHSFIVNDAQAPFFKDGENDNTFHVFNYGTNGTYTMADMYEIEPSFNNEPWEVMTNDFKYLITEAIFAQFAQFGSAIISGDWMISQHGTINGNASTNYLMFDANHPNDNIGTNFIPNYCVDLLTGATYLQNAFVNGNIVAQTGSFSGHIQSVPTIIHSYNIVNFVNAEINPFTGQPTFMLDIYKMGRNVILFATSDTSNHVPTYADPTDEQTEQATNVFLQPQNYASLKPVLEGLPDYDSTIFGDLLTLILPFAYRTDPAADHDYSTMVSQFGGGDYSLGLLHLYKRWRWEKGDTFATVNNINNVPISRPSSISASDWEEWRVYPYKTYTEMVNKAREFVDSEITLMQFHNNLNYEPPALYGTHDAIASINNAWEVNNVGAAYGRVISFKCRQDTGQGNNGESIYWDRTSVADAVVYYWDRYTLGLDDWED